MKKIKSGGDIDLINEKFILLSQGFLQEPGKINREAFDLLADGFMKLDGNFLFPAGEYTPYVFDLSSDRFIRMGEGIEALLGISSGEVLQLSRAAFFSEFLSAEHMASSVALSISVYEFLLRGEKKELMGSMEVNMVTRRKEKKRMLLQFKPAFYDKAGMPTAVWGLFADITPIKKDGPPQLIFLDNGKLVSIQKRNMAVERNTDFLSLNKQDITILDLRAKGLQVKEIAEQSGLQPSTVFSYLRDIRQKTGMDIIPLIKRLTDNGRMGY